MYSFPSASISFGIRTWQLNATLRIKNSSSVFFRPRDHQIGRGISLSRLIFPIQSVMPWTAVLRRFRRRSTPSAFVHTVPYRQISKRCHQIMDCVISSSTITLTSSSGSILSSDIFFPMPLNEVPV